VGDFGVFCKLLGMRAVLFSWLLVRIQVQKAYALWPRGVTTHRKALRWDVWTLTGQTDGNVFEKCKGKRNE
jgi:hypothetical protein